MFVITIFGFLPGNWPVTAIKSSRGWKNPLFRGILRPIQQKLEARLVEELSKLPNIGKAVEEQLIQVGIDSIGELKQFYREHRI